MGKAEEVIKSVLSDSKLSGSGVYRDEPLLFTASQMKSYTPPKYAEMKRLITPHEAAFAPANYIFYKQGRFMENFEDNFDYHGDFIRSFPTYRDMNNLQLRGYFSWRTRLRRGEILKAPPAFAYVYAYELINLIGVSSPKEGFLKLRDFAEKYGKTDRGILPLTHRWLTDFAVYYGLEPELISGQPEFKNDSALICLMDYKTKSPAEITAALDNFSSYKLTGSAFYKKYPRETCDAVYRLFRGLAEHYEGKPGGDIFLRLFAKPEKEDYLMFRMSVFYEQRPHADCVYEINRINKYICRNGSWRTERFCPVKDKAGRLGAILKNTDCRLRQKYGYRSALKPVELSSAFEDIIKKAVEEHYAEKLEKEKPVISIDLSKLEGIRNASEITRDKLIVTEEPDAPEADEASLPGELQFNAPPAETPAPASEAPLIKETAGGGYGLDSACADILKCLLTGGDAGGAARRNGIMLSIAADRINEALFDRFDDTVIDFSGDAPYIIEDYADELKGMFNI